ncbi:MAG: deoxyribodipyrimidine photo-lyase, partial [Usitatibacter sp.]
MPAYRSALFWFRRDLRDSDNAGLYFALKSAARVYCAFVFDRAILGALPRREDRRVEFIWESVRELRESLRSRGGELIVLHDAARDAIPALARRLEVDAVFCNGDYEPDATARDTAVAAALASEGRRFHRAKDQALFEKDEVLTQAGRPFTVFTPYRNAWMKLMEPFYIEAYGVARHARGLAAPPFPVEVPSLEALGFTRTNLARFPVGTGMQGAARLLADFETRIDAYAAARDFPAVCGVSYLGVHNRFGTVSVRKLASLALGREGEGARVWLSELAWRDFYFQVLWHHP